MPLNFGDPVVLLDLKKGRRRNIIIEDKTIKIKGFGVFNPKDFVGKNYGDVIYLGNKPVLLEPPSIVECIRGLRRKAQIIVPKDSGLIALYANIGPGSVVVEGGIGSGGLTIVLANFVRPNGKVISYDINEEFFKIAHYNLRVAGLHEYVEMKLKDIKEGIDESNIDAVVLDIPEPWEVVEHAKESLKSFGHFVAYVPTIEQARRTYLELKNHEFYNLEIVELIMRNILVKPLGTRPNNKVIGHTGYIIVGRKLND
ncbi:MAG: tRNA (adenine-N1)-methyltransferase [Thermoplasmata archaeon]|nr:tRNA (adenine-N1)-methyltransferase [Euryarchaeota archaeon]RLF67073.1 MAG: tRNA (adenine-N1)-methyltransferase [Thermoplasmata archaeon]